MTPPCSNIALKGTRNDFSRLDSRKQQKMLQDASKRLEARRWPSGPGKSPKATNVSRCPVAVVSEAKNMLPTLFVEKNCCTLQNQPEVDRSWCFLFQVFWLFVSYFIA